MRVRSELVGDSGEVSAAHNADGVVMDECESFLERAVLLTGVGAAEEACAGIAKKLDRLPSTAKYGLVSLTLLPIASNDIEVHSTGSCITMPENVFCNCDSDEGDIKVGTLQLALAALYPTASSKRIPCAFVQSFSPFGESPMEDRTLRNPYC